MNLFKTLIIINYRKEMLKLVRIKGKKEIILASKLRQQKDNTNKASKIDYLRIYIANVQGCCQQWSPKRIKFIQHYPTCWETVPQHSKTQIHHFYLNTHNPELHRAATKTKLIFHQKENFEEEFYSVDGIKFQSS